MLTAEQIRLRRAARISTRAAIQSLELADYLRIADDGTRLSTDIRRRRDLHDDNAWINARSAASLAFAAHPELRAQDGGAR